MSRRRQASPRSRAGTATSPAPRRVEQVALGLALLSPVMIIPGGLDRFVFWKVALVVAGATVAGVARPTGRLGRYVWLLVTAAALVFVVASLAGPGFARSFWGRAPRYEGAAMLACYVAAAAAGARLLGPAATDSTRRAATRALTVTAVLVAAVAVAEAFGLRPLETTLSRPGSLLGNASDEGAFGVLVTGVLAAAALRRPDRWNVVGLTCGGFTVALSGSRGALAGLVATAMVLALFAGSRNRRFLLAAGVVVVAGLALLVPSTGPRLLGQSPLAAQTVQGRLLLWGETAELVAGHPWLGVGPSWFGDAIPARHDVRWYREVGTQNPVDSPHNWLLQATASAGAGLGVLAIVLAFLVVRRGVRRARAEANTGMVPLAAGGLAAVVGYGVALLVHQTSPGPTCLAALLGGALLAWRPANPARARAQRWRIGAVILAGGALTAALLLAGAAEIPLRSAILAVSRGDGDAARAGFALARALRPWDIEIDIAAGHAFAVASTSGGDRDAATPYLHRATRALPDNEQVLLDLTTVHEAHGRFAAATASLNRARAGDPHNPELMLREGVLRAEQHDFVGAEQSFLAVVRIDSRSPQPWDNLAQLYRMQGRTRDAEHARSRAADLRSHK